MAEPIAPRPEPVDAPAETVVIEVPPPKKKRRRWIGVLIGLVVLIILLVVGFFIADAYAKTYAENYVRERIVEVLKLDPKSDVEVDLGSGSVLLQAARGALDEVNVHVDEITFGDITGDAQLTATQVPLDSSKPVDKLDIEVTVSEDNVKKLSGFLSGIDLKSIELQDGVIRVGTEFTLLFFTIPVAVDLAPSAVEGGIGFEPQTILLGDEPISVADLRASPEFSALAGDLLNTQVFCVASYLPQALSIADADVVGTDLVVKINGDGVALGGPDLSTNGTCPA